MVEMMATSSKTNLTTYRREWMRKHRAALRLPKLREEVRRLEELIGEQDNGWLPIETAKKNGKPILGILKNPIPDRPDLDRWFGIQFVMRHPGLADDGFDIGWNVAAPVGHGGFPDEWFAGWMPLPKPTTTGEFSERG
jgi:hypothetical protein